jgi:uncharacterized tellurite resistance protein B-like protein
MLVSAIRDFLATPAPTLQVNVDGFSRQELAAAVLMIECARIDGSFTTEERDAICRSVRDRLRLDDETVECLVGIAERRHDEVWHDWLFTETIRRSFDPEDRLGVIERLFEVAWADGEIHRFEAHLIDRIAADLEVSKEEVARARERTSPGRKPH